MNSVIECCCGEWWDRTHESIRKADFGALNQSKRNNSRRERKREPWEAEIVARWLAVNRRRINFVDIDDAGSHENTIRRVSDYLPDPEKLTREIYHR